MRERPIIYNTQMVEGIIDGRKTMTRRPLKPKLSELIDELCYNSEYGEFDDVDFGYEKHLGEDEKTIMPEEWIVWLSDYKAEGCMTLGQCPFGKVGDRLWVRETFSIVPKTAYGRDVPRTINPNDDGEIAIYKEGWYRSPPSRWRPSIHMPRWASRITLEITDVRIERLQDITKEDAEKEGFKLPPADGQGYVVGARTNFKFGWNAIYGNWDENPWVWVIEFKVVE